MDKTLKSTQKRIMNAVKDPNSQSNKNNPLMKLANILDNLDKFIKNEVFSLTEFRQEVEKQFQSADYSLKSTNRFKCILMKCTNKTDALEVIFELSVRTKVAASMVSAFSEVVSISNESLEEIINSFNEIDDSIEGINDSVGKINGSIEKTKKVVDSIHYH